MKQQLHIRAHLLSVGAELLTSNELFYLVGVGGGGSMSATSTGTRGAEPASEGMKWDNPKV